MKKFLLASVALLSLAATANAVDYVDWVDWNRIEHWAGDPDGQNKCALVIDFQDEYDSRALVWGFRWNGTATGEDLVRAVASQSSCLTALVQYTGTMGSTLDGLGISIGREHLDYLSYDFDRAAGAGEVSFGYFEPNTTMGQLIAPGNNTPAMCAAAIERARKTGIIEHPLNAFVYGYPAYDYDYWKLADGTAGYEHRWYSGWYDCYWSYWHGPNDYDYMGYSGLGMSSVVLTDGCVQAWKRTALTGGGFGETGGELAKELEYGMADYEEAMHEADPLVQPVDQSKVDFWVGTGEKAATVVFQFNDGKNAENLVYGYKWTGGWDDDLTTVVKAIAAADPRMNCTISGDKIELTYDSDCDGVIGGTKDHTDTDNTWNFYVKRTVDEGFNKVPGTRWLNPSAVLVMAHQPAGASTVSLPFRTYRPALDSEQVITLPDSISYALADDALTIPMFIQIPEGGKLSTAFSWTRSSEITAVTTSIGTSDFKGKVNGFKNFKPAVGTVSVRGSYTPAGQTKASYVYSNDVVLDLMNPVRPVTAIRYAEANVDARLGHTVANPLIIEPADATYTKMSYTTSERAVATVASTGVVTTTKTGGTSTITAAYDLDADIKASFTLGSKLVYAVEDVTFEAADADGVITLTPKEMTGLFPVYTPADPDIADLTITLSDNGTAKDNYIATMYQVNLWDENNVRTRPYELSGHRVGECKLTVAAQDGTGFTKEFTIKVVEPDREAAIDYNTGTIMLNEEWFGHTNGGLNWFSPDYDVVYQAYERENPGMSFGATSQYGIIYDGKLIVCSKQAVDGGDPLPGGGRVVIADAATLKRLGSIDDLLWGDETRSADGRAAVGAGPGRVYIGSSSGIYIVDTNTFEITGKVGEEALGGDGGEYKPATDPSSSLYSGQIGDMVLAGHHVFAIRQDNGVYVIDIDTDRIVKFIEEKNIQGICQSADGCVWYAATVDGKTNFVALDIESLSEVDRVEVPAEIGTVTCGWGAWRTTQFTGAHSVNALFFSPGSSISNGGAGLIHRYDINTRKFTPLAKVSGLPAHTPGMKQGAYGTIRYDDRSGLIIAGTTESNASGHYRWNWTHFIDAETGGLKRSIELRPYYWFQAHAIFPDAYDPEIEDLDTVELDIKADETEIPLKVTDRDNNDANIRIRLVDTSAQAEAEVPAVALRLEGHSLFATPQAVGTHQAVIALESNGRTVNHTVNFAVKDEVAGIDKAPASHSSIQTEGSDIVVTGHEGVDFTVVSAAGVKLAAFTANANRYVYHSNLPAGVYVIIASDGTAKKLIVKQ